MGTCLRYVSGSEIPLLAQIACKGKIVAVPKAAKQYRWNPDGMYQKEQDRLKPWNKLENHVDISLALLSVIRRAGLNMKEKVPLVLTVLFGLTVGTAKLAMRLVLIQIGL